MTPALGQPGEEKLVSSCSPPRLSCPVPRGGSAVPAGSGAAGCHVHVRVVRVPQRGRAAALRFLDQLPGVPAPVLLRLLLQAVARLRQSAEIFLLLQL